ncbi:hypothetical protein L596_014846 [Steinernema carpocapsae]|uniref:Uncharacterized protein n=1 Tax=Steinernema carpocapsae TaxID=34508 RepID=A0A4U5NDQ0_STECR|nr:hypothetical protein L596_014846 [Steinernema carpocapsae]
MWNLKPNERPLRVRFHKYLTLDMKSRAAEKERAAGWDLSMKTDNPQPNAHIPSRSLTARRSEEPTSKTSWDARQARTPTLIRAMDPTTPTWARPTEWSPQMASLSPRRTFKTTISTQIQTDLPLIPPRSPLKPVLRKLANFIDFLVACCGLFLAYWICVLHFS